MKNREGQYISLGLNAAPSDIIYYLKYERGQNLSEERSEIKSFIDNFIESSRNRYPEFYGNNIEVEFINWGSTQLVYVVTIDYNKHYTLLVNQPRTKFGAGKEEFDNLTRLNELNGNFVIKPRYYHEDGTRELYVTPYMFQSRCIGVESDKWGVWVPEPLYHFRDFSGLERKAINKAMIALLIKLYDEEKQMGIAKCRLDGGDFMIAKGYEKHNANVDYILENIRLIAARRMIPMDFNIYIERLKEELSGKIDSSKLMILGENLRADFTLEEIEQGIELGLKLRNPSSNKTHKLIH